MRIEDKPATPPEVLRTLKTLAPPGSPLEQTAAAMKLAAELQKAKEEQTREEKLQKGKG